MKGLVFFFFLFSVFAGHSQALLSFERMNYDFGAIREVSGPVSYNFKFTNTGNAPVLIKNVESSCGCTSPEWTKQPILPGKTGFVKATFDPKDRPGNFDKTITVFSNAKTPVIELKIKGMVEGRTRTVLDDYPYELASGLRLPTDHISLMQVKKGDTKTMTYGVYNNSGKRLSVSFADVPAYITIAIEPQVLDAGKIGTVKASYNTAKQGEYGLNEENVTLVTNGKKYPLQVSVSIDEDFSGVNKENAPAISVDKKYYSFGSVASAAGAGYTYKITNTGKSPMKIYRVYTNDKRVVAEVSSRELQPGESADVKVSTVKGAESGRLSCLVSVITNCPGSPELSLRFYGEMK